MINKDSSSIFVCSNCGAEFNRWSGKCWQCGQWNTLKEMTFSSQKKGDLDDHHPPPVKLSELKKGEVIRWPTKLEEFDRVLGGGLVQGSVILFAGEPGIGKSTLLLKIFSQFAKNNFNLLYLSGEESNQQIKDRADRIDVKGENIYLYSSPFLTSIIDRIKQLKPQIIAIDSIQTIVDPNLDSSAGSPLQVRECALSLQRLAKENNFTLILVGHVTKEGGIAGPKTLEHLVDTVINIEGDRLRDLRILRSIKNRFGPTDEIGVFQMVKNGLEEVKNPSEVFLDLNQGRDFPGSVVTATLEGTRPILTEIQALTSVTSFGYPRRTATGIDFNRFQQIVTILERRARVNLASQDLLVNVVGGLNLNDPGVDVAIALALASARTNKLVESQLCAFGELGLGGEIRTVRQERKRKEEAHRLGYKYFIKEKNILEVIQKYLSK
jgi:DNA repair protein RadA/Sms